MFKLALILLFLGSFFFGFSQTEQIYKSNIHPPIDIPIYLSGTFGELRSNHFHTGIDIKTQGKEGKNILAIDDGWVSRIKISTSGYGKAIYITHPNGYISVYGHLQRFNDTIQKIVVEEQYKRETFILEMFPEKNQIPVKKGQIIAFSGNTGGSLGPHLHFEIRESKTQKPINPLFFEKIKIKDYYRPRINTLAIYPVDEKSLINGKNDTLILKVSGWGLKHEFEKTNKIELSGRISFGISAYDLMNDIPNKNGVYSVTLWQDSTMIYELQMNQLSFKTGRYINSLIDYSYYQKEGERLIRTQIDTNNNLDIYTNVKTNGVLEFNDSADYQMKFEIRDAYSNLSVLNFKVTTNCTPSQSNLSDLPSKVEKLNLSENETDLKKSQEADSSFSSEYDEDSVGAYIKYNRKFIFSKENLIAEFPSNTFYRSFYLRYIELDRDSNSFSLVHGLHNIFTPVHKFYLLKIKYFDISDSLVKRAYIAYSKDNSDYYYYGGEDENGYLKTMARELGYFKVMLDTIGPEIKDGNFSSGSIVTKLNELIVHIDDSLTGIDTYRATLNNEWILMEYEPKKKKLIYKFDDKLKKGINDFKLIVTDNVGNKSSFNCEIIY